MGILFSDALLKNYVHLSLVMETLLLSLPSCSLGLHSLDLMYTAFTVVSKPLFPMTYLSDTYHYLFLTCLEFFHFLAFICMTPGVKINLRICVVFPPLWITVQLGNNLKKKGHPIQFCYSPPWNRTNGCLWITFSSVKATHFSTLLQMIKM